MPTCVAHCYFDHCPSSAVDAVSVKRKCLCISWAALLLFFNEKSTRVQSPPDVHMSGAHFGQFWATGKCRPVPTTYSSSLFVRLTCQSAHKEYMKMVCTRGLPLTEPTTLGQPFSSSFISLIRSTASAVCACNVCRLVLSSQFRIFF